MEYPHCFVIILTLIGLLLSQPYKVQGHGTFSSARALDALLQDYAYRAFVNPRTGVPYDGTVPSNLTGIQVAGLRLKCGSLLTRGVPKYKEFHIPKGIVVQPYAERLIMVYHNLGNWSSFYYPLPDYSYLTPVVGLLAYDAANLSAKNLNELKLVIHEPPILVDFMSVDDSPKGHTVKCVRFGLDGVSQFSDLVSSTVCSTNEQGHFAIVVSSRGSKVSKIAKIVGAVLGGLLGLLLLAVIIILIRRRVRSKKIEKMEQRADVGEALQVKPIGSGHAPLASGTRTKPVLEDESVS